MDPSVPGTTYPDTAPAQHTAWHSIISTLSLNPINSSLMDALTGLA